MKIYCFAAFHDLGKESLADRILLKPEPLFREKRLVLQCAVLIGITLIEKLITAMGLEDAPSNICCARWWPTTWKASMALAIRRDCAVRR